MKGKRDTSSEQLLVSGLSLAHSYQRPLVVHTCELPNTNRRLCMHRHVECTYRHTDVYAEGVCSQQCGGSAKGRRRQWSLLSSLAGAASESRRTSSDFLCLSLSSSLPPPFLWKPGKSSVLSPSVQVSSFHSINADTNIRGLYRVLTTANQDWSVQCRSKHVRHTHVILYPTCL